MSAECSIGNITPGYKQTEVGVIPEDWEVSTLGHVTEYVKGFAFSAKDYQLHGIKIIRVSDTTYDGIKEEEGIYIDEIKAKSFRKWSLREGDIIVSTVGSKPPMYDSMVGKATFVQAKDSGALLNQNAVILRSRKWSMGSQRLLHNHLKQKRYLAHIEKIFRGNANQASITLKELFEYYIPFPPTLLEEETIAEALSDADALIESLEQLIAKKRQIKQGAMQGLLTGRRRLPEFETKAGYKHTEIGFIPEDWDVATLSMITSEIGDGIHATPVYSTSGNYFFINGNNIQNGCVVITKDTKSTNTSEYNKHRKNLSSDRTLLLSINGTIGNVALYSGEPIFLGKSAAYINVHENTSRLLIFYLLQTADVIAYFNEGLTGTTIKNLGLNTIRNTPVPLPPTKTEQEVIATILSEIDSEITTLEEKLAKASQLKQGMMQELLTGRVRLI